jgi:hypothetical protein
MWCSVGHSRRVRYAVLAVLLFVLLIVAAMLSVKTISVLCVAVGGPPHDSRPLAVGAGDAGDAVERAHEINVDWPRTSECFPPRMVADVLAAARLHGTGFGHADERTKKALAASAEQISKKYGILITMEQLCAVRRMEIANTARHAGVRAMRVAKELVRRRHAGATVLELSAEYKLPPVAILKQLLLECGHGPEQVRALVARPELLPTEFRTEARGIFEADLGSRLNTELIFAEAQAFEGAVGRRLKTLGLSFMTESDLRNKHTQTGAPLLTPDFLLDPARVVRINGVLVRWLDAKNYPALDSPLVVASLEKQAAKYTAAFGPGAFVFNGGVLCETKLSKQGVLMLDGSECA